MASMFGKRPTTVAVAEQSSRPSKRSRTDNFSVKKYEVFISHRGPDVKQSLAYNISEWLEHKGIQAFFDIKEMEAGQTVPQQIQEAIESSKVQIVIFSERFTESKWCLDELAMMIEKHRDGTSIVIPIFYDVQPDAIKFLKGNFGQNFMNKHPKRQTAQKIEEWKKALQEASEISGFCFSELGGALVNKVVTKVCNYLQIGILHVPDNVVGIEQLLTETINHILDNRKQECGLTCVEITGIGGIGKTTFASALYNTIQLHFKRCCFIEAVKDKMEKDGPLQIYKTLLKDLFCTDTQSTTIAQAKAQLKKHIENEDVLIFLDDIGLKSRVSDIVVEDGASLAATSVIIVTSRDTHILKNDRAFCKSTEVIQVKIPKLPLKESRKVFCKYAFGAADFKYDNIYKHLVHKMVEKCDGIPLALKLFGRHVSGEDISYWECFWEGVHDSLPGDLKEVLQITFKSLDSELAKQIFLDVAIFFHGEKVELLENIWVDDLDQNKGRFKFAFEKLKKKCLVEIIIEGELRVHDVLRDMAKAVVDEESELEPGYRSRLWRPHDVKHVLSDKMRTEKVKGMTGLWIKEDFVNPCSWNADVFVGMSSLKVLIIEGKCIYGDLSNLPRGLLFLRWKNYPRTRAPPRLRSVRVLDLSSGHQEYLWESHAEGAPVELRQLILQGCSRIQKLPEWTEKFRWLGKVDMSDCRSLRTIPESFGLLQCLEELDLSGCHSLQELPKTIGRLPKLRRINLEDCETLKSLPESFGWLKMLEYLSLEGCSSLEDIPETFGQLEKLANLNLGYCDHLKSLPDSFGHLKSLSILYLWGCTRLERLPPSFCMLPALQSLHIVDCGLSEPIGERIASLTTLIHLSLVSEKAKNDNIGDLHNLKFLDVESCFNLQQFPKSFCELYRLEFLQIANCSSLQRVSNLPTHLKSFVMSHCESVEVIDVSGLHSLEELEVRGCSSLKNIGGLIRRDGIYSVTTQECRNLIDLGGSHVTDNNESNWWDDLLASGLDHFENLRRLAIQVNGQVFSRNSATTETNIIAPYNSSLLCDAVDQSSNPIRISSPKCSLFPLNVDDGCVIGGDKKEEFSFVASAVFLIIGNCPGDSPFQLGVNTGGSYRYYGFRNEGEAALLQMELFTDNPKKASVGNQVVNDFNEVVKEGWICCLETEGEIYDDNERVWDYFAKECKRHLHGSLSTVSSDFPTSIAIRNNCTLDPSPITLMKHFLNP